MNKASKKKKIYYYKAEIKGLSPLQSNLQQLLITELNSLNSAYLTRHRYETGKYRLIGHRYSLSGYLGLRFMSYEAGNKAQVFNRALRSENVNTTAVAPPKNTDEFLEGIAYAVFYDNEIILSLSSSFKDSTVEEYLNWLLFKRNKNKNAYIQLIKGSNKQTLKNIKNIKSFEFFTIPEFTKELNFSKPKGANKGLVNVFSKMFKNTDLTIDYLLDASPITMFGGYKINQRFFHSQIVFDEFSNKILQNIDPSLDWKIETKDKVIKRNEVYLATSIYPKTIDDIIDDLDIYDKMELWCKSLKMQNLI